MIEGVKTNKEVVVLVRGEGDLVFVEYSSSYIMFLVFFIVVLFVFIENFVRWNFYFYCVGDKIEGV